MADSNNEIIIEAKVDKLDEVISFIDSVLETAGCSMKTQIQIDVAVEEIFVNIANYAYDYDGGMATVRINIDDCTKRVEITFIDEGIPYNPLERTDPDVTLSVEERPIGGLGVYMVKKSMDEVTYDYREGKNILTIIKEL
ncbi:MAG: ATP-binding protein [Lachnospiraceae bacterium]|nr:ATP-binding protein [Lachnospiraceae bacterium]MBQ9233966.1 ATP-binding protein [Lachnospiraceae bacterium]